MRLTSTIRRPCPGTEPGIALIIVMISIFVLTVLAGGFAYSMKVETRLARNANSETELEWLGRSAVECARWELAEQLRITQERWDSLDQVWAGGPGGMFTSNSPLADFKAEIQSLNGSATWKIVDCERKYNINFANEQTLEQALTVMGVDAGETTPVVGAMLDWMDPDDVTHTQGAESDYYQSLDPPYYAKNGPIDDISELLLIKGVSQELYWGSSSTNHPPGAIQPTANRSHLPNQPVAYPVGLVDLFTPLSSGRININTASAEVLQLLPGVDPIIAGGIVNGRSGEDDGSGMFGPYRSVQDVALRVPDMPRVGPLNNILSQFCDVRSRTFEVQVDAQVNSYHRHFTAILGRSSPTKIDVLTFYWK